MRLDPFALPLRFPASDARADGQIRHVELDRDRVVVRRSVRGIPMAVRIPVAEFRGVALRLTDAQDGDAARVTVTLDHRDQALAVPLYSAPHADDITAVWQAWGRVLGLPLLIAEESGDVREPFSRLGAVMVEEPAPRRRRRSALRRRRPSILLRRKPGRKRDEDRIHRGEREIIARN
jgi:hypothetical protein